MTTITWRDSKSGKTTIEIIKSKDKLENICQSLRYDVKANAYGREVKEKVKNKYVVVSIQYAVGFSYDTEVERAIFSRYKLIPRKEDYPNGD